MALCGLDAFVAKQITSRFLTAAISRIRIIRRFGTQIIESEVLDAIREPC